MSRRRRSVQPLPGKRISVVGTSGSGKTIMARNLAKVLGVPHIELDELHWGPNWTEKPDEVFRVLTIEALAGRDAWTADGNYKIVRDIILGRADTLVWLDFPLPLILWRLTRRTFGRAIFNEPIWHDNKENLHTHLFTKDSLYWWVLTTYKRRRIEYTAFFRDPEYKHIIKIRLRSAREADRWLNKVQAHVTKQGRPTT